MASLGKAELVSYSPLPFDDFKNENCKRGWNYMKKEDLSAKSFSL